MTKREIEKLSDHERECLIGYRQRCMREESPQRADVYRHYKGDLYVVLARAIDETSLEDMVVYQNLASVWVRPHKEWIELVGKTPRFERMPNCLEL